MASNQLSPQLLGKINIKKQSVTFESSGLSLSGDLYIPDGIGDGKYPAIVVSHPASGVKEQTAGLYARNLAEHGFITLAFDATYNGESAGEPRGLEDPGQRIEDIKAAVSFISLHDNVDSEKIGLLGICASGGYAIPATASDHRIKAVATVSGISIGEFFRVGYDGKQPSSVLNMMLDNAGKARTDEARNEATKTFPIFPADEAAARALGQYVYEGWEYYCTPRGYHPRSAKQMPWISVDKMVTFDGFRFIHLIAPRPVLTIVGTKAATKWMAEEAFPRAGEPKELFWIEGASHVDLYDKEQFVIPAVAKLSDFYRDSLGV
ncbi:alpha/beta hydrolase [Rouxiella sp. Mn2063]|uniref:alpha/beta hydrolase n=1 Tax=Rouxiella sp. Mn2063 TaxID=3395262 RepID=UPI003BDA3C05